MPRARVTKSHSKLWLPPRYRRGAIGFGGSHGHCLPVDEDEDVPDDPCDQRCCQLFYDGFNAEPPPGSHWTDVIGSSSVAGGNLQCPATGSMRILDADPEKRNVWLETTGVGTSPGTWDLGNTAKLIIGYLDEDNYVYMEARLSSFADVVLVSVENGVFNLLDSDQASSVAPDRIVRMRLCSGPDGYGIAGEVLYLVEGGPPGNPEDALVFAPGFRLPGRKIGLGAGPPHTFGGIGPQVGNVFFDEVLLEEVSHGCRGCIEPCYGGDPPQPCGDENYPRRIQCMVTLDDPAFVGAAPGCSALADQFNGASFVFPIELVCDPAAQLIPGYVLNVNTLPFEPYTFDPAKCTLSFGINSPANLGLWYRVQDRGTFDWSPGNIYVLDQRETGMVGCSNVGNATLEIL